MAERQGCKTDGCTGEVARRGLCRRCYNKAYYSGQLPKAATPEVIGQVDEATLAAVVAKWEGPLRRRAVYLLTDRQQAEEVVQDVFLGLWRHGLPEHLKAWLYASCANACMDRLRSRRARKALLAAMPLEDAYDIGTPDPAADILEAMEAHREAQVILNSLSDTSRKMLLLEAQGFTLQEMADHLGIPRGTVKSRLGFARERARSEAQKLRSA